MDKELLELLENLSIGLSDWLHTYAGDCCDPVDVKESFNRLVQHGGTIGYIADLQRSLREYREQNK